jgi:tRNA-binding protein
MKSISWQDFEKVEIRAGTISRVEDFPEAKVPRIKSGRILVISA